MPQGRSRIDQATVSPRSRAVASKAFDVGMLTGPATWGPMNQATICIDYPDYYEKFGGFLAAYHTTLAAKLFFESGGKRLVMTRICHIADHSVSATPLSAVKALYTFPCAAAGTYLGADSLTATAKYYGTLGNSIVIKIQNASNEVASSFDLLVYVGTELKEWFRNLSMLDSATRYVETVINDSDEASKYIVVTDLALGGVAGLALDERPENNTGATLVLGDDGLTSLVSADYIGAVSYHTGLHAFSLEEQGDLMFTPDDTTTAYVNAAVAYCADQKKGKVFFLCETPVSTAKAAAVIQVAALTASEYRSAMYWPRVRIANPSKSIFGQAPRLVVAPSPLIAGRMVRNSNKEEGMYFTQPGNEIYGLLDYAVALESDKHEVLEPTVRDYVTDFGVNPIMEGIRPSDGNFGVWCDDVLLGSTTGNFISVGEQRGIAYLRTIFEAYLERHRTQNMTPMMRRTIKEAFEAELAKWLSKHVFASDTASEAFYVHTDPEGTSLNNPAVQDAQQLRILIGVATARPARFIELAFTRDNRAVESWIQQQLSATSA